MDLAFPRNYAKQQNGVGYLKDQRHIKLICLVHFVREFVSMNQTKFNSGLIQAGNL